MGVVYKNHGDLDAAVACYERCLVVSPNFEIAKNNIAIALKDLGTKTEDLQQKAARDEDEDVKKRKKLYREIIAKQVELGCEVVEILREYLDDKDGYKDEAKVSNDETNRDLTSDGMAAHFNKAPLQITRATYLICNGMFIYNAS